MRWIGWFFILLGIILLAGFGVAAGFLEGELPLLAKVAGGSGAALVVIGLYGQREFFTQLSEDQTTGRSVNAIVATALAGAILVVANVAAHDAKWRWDATKNKQYTLSQQSIDLVAKLDRQVAVQAFFNKGSPEEKSFKDLVEQYAEHSTLLKVEYHDPNEEPLLAEQMKLISDQGTVVLKSGEKEQRIESGFDESAITNALVRVTSDEQHHICVVTGHGEMDPNDSSSPSGLGFAKDKLSAQNYSVTTVTLTASAPSPTTCEVVILGAPQTEVLPEELDRLAQYVAAGGSLIAMLDPSVPASTANDFARYGFKPGADVVVEADPYRIVQNNPFGLIIDQSSYEPHPLTEKLKGNSILFLSRSVDAGVAIPGVEVKVLARASESAWGETDLQDPNGQVEPTPGKDLVGKVPLIAVAEVQDPSGIRTTTTVAAPLTAEGMPAAPVVPPAPSSPPPTPKAGGKVVAFGDADFASNQMFANGLNQDLLLNTVAWMVGEEAQMSIRANEAAKGRLEMSTVGLLLMWLISLLVMPGLMVMGAIATWVYRRRL